MQKVVSWLNENKSSTCLEKTKLNLEKCSYSDCVPLDENGKLDDFKDGEYGILNSIKKHTETRRFFSKHNLFNKKTC